MNWKESPFKELLELTANLVFEKETPEKFEARCKATVSCRRALRAEGYDIPEDPWESDYPE